MRLSGRTAIITGVDNVIGRAVARRFAGEGARLMLVDGGAGEADPLAEELTRTGLQARAVSADLTGEAGWERTLSACTGSYGPVDLLFNGAHWFHPQSVRDLDPDDFCACFDRNALPAWLGQKHVIGAMRRHGRGGAVINLVSAWARVGAAKSSALCAAARGVLMSTKSAALECARDGSGIVVNALVVGRIDGAPSHFPGASELPEANPVDPERVAAAATFLAAEGSAFMTGAEITVDSGLLGVR